MVKDDILTMGEKMTMCLSPLGAARLEAMCQRDLAYTKCGECGADLRAHEYMICLPCSVTNLGRVFSDFGVALDKALQPAIDALTVAFQSIPDKKQIARQRSRDDLKAKRGSLRRGSYGYRR